MENNEMLDTILRAYQDVVINKQKLVFKDVCISLKSDITDEEIRGLKIKLLTDQYLNTYKYGDGNEPYGITPLAVKHLINGGYTKAFLEKQTDDLIKTETLNKFKRDKWAFRISIIAILLSFIALIKSFFFR